MGYGVMVTLQILVLSFLVRVRVSQQRDILTPRVSFFLPTLREGMEITLIGILLGGGMKVGILNITRRDGEAGTKYNYSEIKKSILNIYII